VDSKTKDKGFMTVLRSVTSLSPEKQLLLIRLLYPKIPPEQRTRIFDLVCLLSNPTGKWAKIEKYMEGLFQRDMKRTPKSAASLTVTYFKVNSKMFPFLIKMAQRVKNKVWMRENRKAAKLDA